MVDKRTLLFALSRYYEFATHEQGEVIIGDILSENHFDEESISEIIKSLQEKGLITPVENFYEGTYRLTPKAVEILETAAKLIP